MHDVAFPVAVIGINNPSPAIFCHRATIAPHSGGLQLARRFTGDELKPSYREGEIAQALNLVNIALLLLLHMFFVRMGCQNEDEEAQTLLRHYSADFGERLRDGQ